MGAWECNPAEWEYGNETLLKWQRGNETLLNNGGGNEAVLL